MNYKPVLLVPSSFDMTIAPDCVVFRHPKDVDRNVDIILVTDVLHPVICNLFIANKTRTFVNNKTHVGLTVQSTTMEDILNEWHYLIGDRVIPTASYTKLWSTRHVSWLKRGGRSILYGDLEVTPKYRFCSSRARHSYTQHSGKMFASPLKPGDAGLRY